MAGDKLGWILVHSPKRYKDDTPYNELRNFQRGWKWHWTRGRPLNEGGPYTLLFAWEKMVFGMGKGFVTHDVEDEEFNFAFKLTQYKEHKPIPLEALPIPETYYSLITLNEAILSAYQEFLSSAIDNFSDFPDEVAAQGKFSEGRKCTVTVNVYERDAAARKTCIAHYGTRCQLCNIDFVKRYGEIGRGFIHVHHLRLLSSIGEEYTVDPITDLRPVCPNCHAMLHRNSPPYTIEWLRRAMKDSKK